MALWRFHLKTMKNNHHGRSHFSLVHAAHNLWTCRHQTDAYPSFNMSSRLVLALLFVCLAGSKVSAQVTAQPAQSPAQAPGRDAVLPAGMSPNWDRLNVQTLNRKRTEALLNGTWRFVPAVEGASQPPQAGWGFIRVPGSWASGEGGFGPGRWRRRYRSAGPWHWATVGVL